jgi:hypothetical protein
MVHACNMLSRHITLPSHSLLTQIEPAPTEHGHVGDDDNDNDDKPWHMCEALQISREVSEGEAVLLIKPHHASL